MTSPSLPSSWADHIEGIEALGEAILACGWKPSAILAIARGGLVPATILAYILDVRVIEIVRVRYYDKDRTRLDTRPELVDESPSLDKPAVKVERLLIVDDIIDTGATIEIIRNLAQNHADEVKVASLYVRSNQKMSADWYWRVEDEWVVFPWEPES